MPQAEGSIESWVAQPVHLTSRRQAEHGSVIQQPCSPRNLPTKTCPINRSPYARFGGVGAMEVKT